MKSYRPLKPGQTIKSGDIAWSLTEWQPTSRAGAVYTPRQFQPHLRPVKMKAATAAKEGGKHE